MLGVSGRITAFFAASRTSAPTGFAGRELVPRYRIRVGREIGSAALVADGLHARTDGYTSLAVLYQAAREIYRRLIDAVDPALVDQAEHTPKAAAGVLGVGLVRLRWVGRQLLAECEIAVNGEISAISAHEIAVNAEHDLLHALPRLAAAIVHTDPRSRHGPARALTCTQSWLRTDRCTSAVQVDTI